MAVSTLGNRLGISAKKVHDAKICEIASDAANIFGVAAQDRHRFYLDQSIIFRIKSTGAVFGSTVRTVTSITAVGIGYSGADLTLVPGTHAVYDDCLGVGISSVASDTRVGLNGGPSAGRAFASHVLEDVDSMRAALTAFSGTTFTAARLDAMTFNDLVYACRVSLYSDTI